jgi:hypothetical protein
MKSILFFTEIDRTLTSKTLSSKEYDQELVQFINYLIELMQIYDADEIIISFITPYISYRDTEEMVNKFQFVKERIRLGMHVTLDKIFMPGCIIELSTGYNHDAEKANEFIFNKKECLEKYYQDLISKGKNIVWTGFAANNYPRSYKNGQFKLYNGEKPFNGFIPNFPEYYKFLTGNCSQVFTSPQEGILGINHCLQDCVRKSIYNKEGYHTLRKLLKVNNK